MIAEAMRPESCFPPRTLGAQTRASSISETLGCMYRGALYTRLTMSAEKTIAVSFRVSPRFKLLLEAAASREHRSQTNMLETLLFDFCEQRGIVVTPPEPKNQKATNK